LLIGEKDLETMKLAPPASLLVVDDEPGVIAVIQEMLEQESYRLVSAYSVAEAASILRRQNVNIVLTDLFLGDGSGADIMDIARQIHPESLTILMTGRPTIQNAISMMKEGAYDYLAKPFSLETLRLSLRRAEEKIRLEQENIKLKEMMSFYRISEAMGSTLDLEGILRMILDSSVKEFEADLASLYIVSGTEIEQVQKASMQIMDPSIEKQINEHCAEVSRETIGTRSPMIFNDPDAEYSPGEFGIKSSICQPLLARGEALGALIVVRSKNPHPFSQGQLTGLGLMAAKAAAAVESSNLYRNLKESYISTVQALANAIEARDRYTRGHTERVYKLSKILAEELGWTEAELGDLRMGGILHDIGKIGVPDSILNKPGPLTAEEIEIMKSHPEKGARMIDSIPFLSPALPYIKYHHERHDGTGYPYGLKGEEIPLPGRLLAVVDTIDAVTSDRPYRKGRTLEEAIEEIKKNSGTQFHPEIVEACVTAFRKGKLHSLFHEYTLLDARPD
jgi:putative nucleotidyltransferase with HDIG domain